MTSAAVNMVLALSCEAQPLINSFGLKRLSGLSYPLYRGKFNDDESELNLVVAGVGKLNTATAVGWLAARIQGQKCAWLNLGTAGHASLPVETIARVVHCLAQNEQFSHYPPQVIPWEHEIIAVITGNAVVNEYPAERAVDMEASAFFQSALKFCNAEWVQSLKVISDNPSVDVADLTPKRITALMAANVTPIKTFISALFSSMALVEVSNAGEIEDYFKHLRCTLNQRLQLNELLQSHLNVGATAAQLSALCSESSQAKSLIAVLTKQLQTTAPALKSNKA